MEITSRKRLMVFSGSSNEGLAREVANILGTDLGGVEREVFANSEIYIHFTESVRGADCFVIQSHVSPINYHIVEQLIMIDALKRASAKRITAVIPHYGYARQDKKGRPREPITAKLIGDLFVTAGADRLAVAGAGGACDRRRHLDAAVAFIDKRRSTDVRNKSQSLEVVGEVNGRHCIIVDDIIDTAGSAVGAAELLQKRGALSVRLAATHGVLSDPAVDRIKNSVINEVVISNTLPVPDDATDLPTLTVLSIGSVLAGAINAIFTDASVSAIFKGENM